jgi:hypothetical protein
MSVSLSFASHCSRAVKQLTHETRRNRAEKFSIFQAVKEQIQNVCTQSQTTTGIRTYRETEEKYIVYENDDYASFHLQFRRRAGIGLDLLQTAFCCWFLNNAGGVWMMIHKLCNGLDPVGENLLSSLKKPPPPPSPPNRRWATAAAGSWARPRPTPTREEAEESGEGTVAAPFVRGLDDDGCPRGDGAGMTLPRSETPLSTRGMRDTSRRILKHLILFVSAPYRIPYPVRAWLPLQVLGVVVASPRELSLREGGCAGGEGTGYWTCQWECSRDGNVRLAAAVAARRSSPLAWRLQGALHARSAAPCRALYRVVLLSLPLNLGDHCSSPTALCCGATSNC